MARLTLAPELETDCRRHAEDFQAQVRRLTARYRALWWACESSTPSLGPPLSRRQQRGNERATKELIDELASRVQDYPEEDDQREAWQDALRERIRDFGEKRLGWPRGYRDLLFGDGFHDSTVVFVRQARGFDQGVTLDDVGQALRNVWIVNSLQMLLDRDVELTPAIFAYSMLYPYTDNFLDDPKVSRAEKQETSEGLESRLEGLKVEPRSSREEAVYRLVEIIEGRYSRAHEPQVFQSLLAIHHAQSRSLQQQGGLCGPFEEDSLGGSLEKGGTSVLADGYLAAGELSPEQRDFCFAYGVFLQLLDDLQDVRADLAAGQRTIFSQTALAWPLDGLTSRLYHFIHKCLELSPFSGPRHAQRIDLIRRNCVALLVGAVADNAELFSRPFVRSLESCWPLRFKALGRLRRRVQRRKRQTIKSLRRRMNVGSLMDLLDDPAAPGPGVSPTPRPSPGRSHTTI